MKNNKILSDYKGALKSLAFKPRNSLGRRYYDDSDIMYNVLNPFFLDREKIRLSKSYRRLADKTQVFPPALHSNIRNRLIHTNDVVNLASIYAEVLGLNVNLAEAIAYGHDIGHTPFGHLGETLIRDLSGKNFAHNVMSVVVAQKIERRGKGLNLTYETLEGILNHSRGKGELKTNSNISSEATVVMYADKIAYIFSDLNDATKVGFLKYESFPEIAKYFGKTQRERVANVSFELIKESSEEGKVSFCKSECAQKFADLKSWMYDNVYHVLDKQEYRDKTKGEMEIIISFILNKFNGQIDPYLAISCMTDSEVKTLFKEINDGNTEKLNYGFFEIITNFSNKEIDIFSADLNKSDFLKKYL
jgi:dGTPase